jgi:hypothetical protein
VKFNEQLEQLREDLRDMRENKDVDGVANLTLRIEVVERLQRLDKTPSARRYCRAVLDLERADGMDQLMLEMMGFAEVVPALKRTESGFSETKVISLTKTGKMAAHAYDLHKNEENE